MPATLRIEPCKQGHLYELIETMRSADRQELKVSTGLRSSQALMQSCAMSDPGRLWVVLDEDSRVVAIFGVAHHPYAPEVGICWLVGSDLITSKGLAFGRLTADIVQTAEAGFQMLYNYVGLANETHVRWLEFAGFTFGHDMNINGEPFRMFWKLTNESEVNEDNV